MNKPKKALTIAQLNNTAFSELYKKLLFDQNITDEEKVKLLSISVILINQSDKNLQHLGYRITLLYAIKTKDYKPLYELALNNGLMPVAHLIDRLCDDNQTTDLPIDSFFSTFIRSHIDTFKSKEIIFTEQQFLLNKIFHDKKAQSLSIIAPTSYGKSELILNSLRENYNKKTCIIVPTKALIAQTRKRILVENIPWIKKIITHHEMYNNQDESFSVFVLTQERLHRLMNTNPNFSFDLVFIDEAHNLLNNDSRNRLLASTLCVLEYRNKDIIFKFLTPFLINANHLNRKYSQCKADFFRIDEYVKSERFYIFDFRANKQCSFVYDQFLNKTFEFNTPYLEVAELITKTAAVKNIIYINTPKKLQQFAVEFAEQLPPISCPILLDACKELASHIDVEYHLIDCLRKGIVYHHGSVPDTIRLYVEYLFNQSSSLKYLISSSTLLEGVNLPIERLYLLSNQKGASNLSSSQFKNLIGRVSRFSEVFTYTSDDSIKKLAPKIYLIGTEGYIRSDANLEKFIKKVMNVTAKQEDDVQNELLTYTEITDDNRLDFEKIIEHMENLEKGIISDYNNKYVKTKIGYLLLAHNVQEINIFEKEVDIQSKLEVATNELGMLIKDSKTLLKVIADCFISELVSLDENNSLLSRLQKDEAQNFYAMFLDWKIERLSMKETIQRILFYWNNLPAGRTTVYVGRKWGDLALNETNPHIRNYTKISDKTEKEKINLAILRIKEEQDFIENNLFKFIDILYESEFLDESFFKKIKYGTDDPVKIALIKNGFSLTLTDLMLSKDYHNDLVIENESAYIRSSAINKMRENNEGSFIIFEAELYTK